MMGMRFCFPGFFRVLLGMAISAAGHSQEVRLNRAKALAELGLIEQKNEQLTQDLLAKSARDFSEAADDKSKANQTYLESYRNVVFGRTQEGDTRFQQWKVENKDKLASLEFMQAVQLHVRYLALVCRQAMEEKQAPRPEEWSSYWQSLFASRDIPESPGDFPEKKDRGGKKSGTGPIRKGLPGKAEDFDRPALESPLVRDRQIQGFLGGVKEANVPSGSVEAVFNRVIRPRLREAKSRELLKLWDQRISFFDEEAEKEAKTLGSDDYKVLRRPELLWERADDLEKMGEEEAAWSQKLAILKSSPYHPKVPDWTRELKKSLGGESAALPETKP